MPEPLQIVMLLTDAFGGFGGIAKFNRDFLEALAACGAVKKIDVLPRMIPEPIVERIPQSVTYDHKAALGKISFMQRVAAHIWRTAPIDLVICGHRNLLPAAWCLARSRGARLALIVHGVESWTPPKLPWLNWLARRADDIIAVSRLSAERFSRWSGVAADRIFILPNSVDLDRFQPQARDSGLAARYNLGSGKMILTIGRLAAPERSKGFDEIIELMPRLLKRFPTLKYLIAGDGSDRVRLEEKAHTAGVSSQVIFAGRIPESEMAAHYNLADAYVMPSSGEGFGIVLIEAAACGVPVVGSSIDGSREALLDGQLGRLADPGNADELLEKITAALNSGTRQRNEAIATFGKEKFRARVVEWVRQRQSA